MEEAAGEEFLFSYESDASGSYLAVTADACVKIWNYQVEMIANNRFRYILPFYVKRMDDAAVFCYNITSRLSLSQFLQKRKIKRNDFLTILLNIGRALLDCRNYLLKDRCFILDMEYIYINPATLEISMAYMPVKNRGDACLRFKKLVMDMIMHTADFDECAADNFIQRILGYAKSESFSAAGFQKLLKELAARDLQERPGIGEQAGEESGRPDCKAGGKGKDGRKEKEGDGPGNQHDVKLIAAAVLVQAVIAAAVIGIIGRGFLNRLNGNTAITYLAVALIAAAVNILLFKRLNILLYKGQHKALLKGGAANSANGMRGVNGVRAANGAHGADKNVTNGAQAANGTCGANSVRGAKKSAAVPAVCRVPAKNERPNQEESVEESCEPEFLERAEELKAGMAQMRALGREMGGAYDKRSETVFLGCPEEKYPYLLGERDGVVDRISIDSPEFTVGRLEGLADFICKSRAVGKVHARIISRDGLYFLVDLNSRNGTFINGVRIESNKDYEIRSNDRISFANTCYTFLTPAGG